MDFNLNDLDFIGIVSDFQHLNRARQSIDRAILSMKLNVTRNMSQEIAQDNLVDKNQNRSDSMQANRAISGRTSLAITNGNSISILTNTLSANRAKIS